MKMLKGLIAALILGVFSGINAGHKFIILNKTPYVLNVRAISTGVLNSGWKTINANANGEVGPGALDCMKRLEVQAFIPGKGFKPVGTLSVPVLESCFNRTVVVGIEPTVKTEAAQGISTTGTIGVTKSSLDSFKFYMVATKGDVIPGLPETDIKF